MNEITDKEFALLRDFIKNNYGISLNDEKKSLIYSRLHGILKTKGMKDFTEYYDYLVKDRTGEAGVTFVNKITTNHTFFMREADHFDYLRDKVLPYIEEAHGKTKDLRLWCAASSSGEEPYTLQMIIQDYFENKPGWNTEILATDISTHVLNKAISGIYSNESVSTLPEKWRKKYMKKYDEDNYIMLDILKKSITYRKFNLMDASYPFKKPFQCIFARNVMIYFDNFTRTDVVNKFYQQTERNGYLFIGHSESLNQVKTDYKYITPAIYRRSN